MSRARPLPSGFHHSVDMTMSTVADLIDCLENMNPPALAEGWDNVGLLLGRCNACVSKVLTCLTLSPDVAAEAVEQGVQFVVSHHPILFRGTKKITDADLEGAMLLSLIENGIAVYSPHTSFDSAAEGINQQLARSFGLQDIRPIRPVEEDESIGGGRIGCLPVTQSLSQFLVAVRNATDAAYLEYSGESESTVRTVAIACGSAGEFIDDAIRQGCDTFVTGETRFHTALDARALGVNLILLGHYSSERPAVERLTEALAREFPSLEFFASRVERDPLSVFQA